MTGFVAEKVGCATMALGKFLAPHVHAQGSKLLSKTMGYDSTEAHDKVKSINCYSQLIILIENAFQYIVFIPFDFRLFDLMFDFKLQMGGVLTVAAGAVEGFGTVYDGLEKSAGILGKNLGDNSVKIIEHKYGTTAGALATDTFDTVGNLINLNRNVGGFTSTKRLIRKTVKGTGKALIGDFRPNIPSKYRKDLLFENM